MPRLASLLQSKLPEETIEVLKTAGELAASGEHGTTEVFIVGGMVRDLILARTPKDPDIVVVGNGQRFARALADKINGEVSNVSQFGTAIINSQIGRIDVATARDETYSSPAALPNITPSGMEDDLKRRDFSVNAMAISIHPDSWGELLDPHKGFSDCARKRLRILHDQSFQDDPTRILRAVRYEVRLGFSFTLDTAEALERDLPNIDKLSSARVLAEVKKILEEPRRTDILRRAEALKVLGAISPSLRVSENGLKAMQQFEKEGEEVDPLNVLAFMTSSLTTEEANAVIERLEPEKEWRAVIGGAARFREVAAVLESSDLLPSEVVELLEPIPVQVLEFQKTAGPKTRQKEHLEAYLRRHRNIRPELTGNDLEMCNVPRGPIMGLLLSELKTARLNGKISTREEEFELVRKRLPILLGLGRRGTDRFTGAAVP